MSLIFRGFVLFFGTLLLAFAQAAWGQQSAPTAAPAAASRPAVRVYDEQADAAKDIAGALERATHDNQRVLVVFGANWCGWCRKLHALFTENPDIARKLLNEYQVVWVDVGRFDKHAAIAQDYGLDLKKTGVPALTVLDAAGKVLVNQETGSLELQKDADPKTAGEGPGLGHDSQKVAAFLDQYKAPPQDAEQVFVAALAQARDSDRRVFIHLGAPWCGWCRRLESFLAEPRIAEILAKDYVLLKIDLDRMRDAKPVCARRGLKTDAGLPWLAILAADGKLLATSEAPATSGSTGGNIGYPVKPEEIAHFMQMLEKTQRHLDAAQRDLVRNRLTDRAKELESPGGH
jgi:thiol:disulfide interchange protein